MRTINYKRWEMNKASADECSENIVTFIFDVPFLSWNGAIPPLKHLNAILKTGGSDGGMTPGATWEPFHITESEYEELCSRALTIDMGEIKKKARYAPEKVIIDHSLDSTRNHLSWLREIRKKYSC